MATKQDLKELEYRLVIRLAAIMGSMFALSVGVLLAAIRFYGNA